MEYIKPFQLIATLHQKAPKDTPRVVIYCDDSRVKRPQELTYSFVPTGEAGSLVGARKKAERFVLLVANTYESPRHCIAALVDATRLERCVLRDGSELEFVYQLTEELR